MIKFEKVSLEQFLKDCKKGTLWYDLASMPLPQLGCPSDEFIEEVLTEWYNSIELPTRSTSGSAGYDFKAPYGFKFENGQTVLIPTGIRAKMDKNIVLSIYPRSGLGFKHRVQLDNTVGIIDSDYYYSDNEGHIMVKLTHDGYMASDCKVEAGKGFCQGIFSHYLITDDDNADGVRNGGFGSTDAQSV